MQKRGYNFLSQFEPPAPGLFGYGSRHPHIPTSKFQIAPAFNFSVGDHLEVPGRLLNVLVLLEACYNFMYTYIQQSMFNTSRPTIWHS